MLTAILARSLFAVGVSPPLAHAASRWAATIAAVLTAGLLAGALALGLRWAAADIAARGQAAGVAAERARQTAVVAELNARLATLEGERARAMDAADRALAELRRQATEPALPAAAPALAAQCTLPAEAIDAVNRIR
jgi:hypothetical protein